MPETTHCQLNVEPFFQCCCNCTMRVTDYKHCSIHGRSEGKCVCSQPKGYVCLGFADEGVVHSEWPEHSCGCELYMERVAHAAAIGDVEYRSWFTTLPATEKTGSIIDLARRAGVLADA